MAWYIQRYGCFKDDNENFYQVEIYSETVNVVSAQDEFTLGSDGFTLSYKGQGADIDDPIKSSECSFTFYSKEPTDDAFFLDVMNAEVGKYLVRITLNTAPQQDFQELNPRFTYWTGILVLQETTLQDDHYPQAFRMRAIDGLSLLKSFKVSELTELRDSVTGTNDPTFAVGVNGAMSGSWYSHNALVFACLRLLPTAEAFYVNNYVDAPFAITYFNWWTDRTIYEDDIAFYNPMTVCFARSDAYYTVGNSGVNTGIQYMSAYDVLRYILEFYNARISMSDGTWQIQQICAMAVTADAGDPGPTVKAARWNTNAIHYNNNSPFDAVLNRGSLDVGYECQRAEANFTFSPATRDVTLEVKDGPNLIFGDGEEFGSAEYDYALLGDIPVGTNIQPTLQQYTNTFVGGSAGDLITFTMQFGVRFTTPAQPAGGWITNYTPTSAYLAQFKVFVRQDNFWLLYNIQEDRFEWTDTQVDVYAAAGLGFYAPLQLGMNEIYSFNLGGINTDQMDELPSDGAIRYHVAFRVLEIDPINQTQQDVTPGGWGANQGAVTVSQTLDTDGNYGLAENFVTVGLTLFLNGENYDQNLYFFEEGIGAATISGASVEKESMFFDGPAIFRKNNIFYLNQQGFLGLFQWGLTGSWYYRNNQAGARLLAQVLKGDEYLRLTNRQKIVLTGKILRYDVPKPSPDPLYFHEIFREPITGFGDQYFIFNGGKFTARSNEWNGEWRSLSMSFVNTGGKIKGNKIKDHVVNSILIGNLQIAQQDNNNHKIL